MNILPLVIAFLTIFACITVSFLREAKSFSLIETTIHGYNRTDRAVSNAIVRKSYRKIKVETNPKKETEPKKVLKQNYHSMREFYPPLESSKFHLGPLLKAEGDLKQHPLYEPLAQLFRLLYGKCLFKNQDKSEKLEYHLIEEIVKNAKKMPNSENLAELYPEDPHLQKIYYKMLKGTNNYTQDVGIPPLEHFVSLEKSEKAVVLGFASPLLLEALFGKEVASEILNLERKKWSESNNYYYFSKEDFQLVFNKSPNKASLLTVLDSFLDYSKQFETRSQIGGRDRITGIGVEKEI